MAITAHKLFKLVCHGFQYKKTASNEIIHYLAKRTKKVLSDIIPLKSTEFRLV